MGFPPNYNQDRSNRDRTKSRNALKKQLKREERSIQRKQDRSITEDESGSPTEDEKKP